VRPVNLFVDEEKAEDLREKLLMYRFKNLGGQTAEIKLSEMVQNARVIELFISLLQVSPTEEIRKRLMLCMKEIAQSRLEEEQASLEARLFDSVLKCETKIEGGKLTTQAVTETFNEGLSEKEQSTSRFVGRKLRALGFEKCRVGNKGQAGFFWDTKLVERLKKRYFPASSQTTSVTTETSETTATMDKTNIPKTVNAEVTEETEVTEVKSETASKPSSEPVVKLECLKSVYWNDGFWGWHNCAICGQTKLTSWEGETFKGDKVWLCDDCKAEWERQREVPS
jgi:hypothetical protein